MSISSLFNKESEKGKEYIKQKCGVEVQPVQSLTSDTLCLFSIYDKVCEEYNPPFVSRNLAAAIRSLRESLSNKQSLLAIHPEDYKIVKVGYFNTMNGLVSYCDVSEYIEVSSLVVQDKENDIEVQK